MTPKLAFLVLDLPFKSLRAVKTSIVFSEYVLLHREIFVLGDMQMQTTNRSTYHSFDGAQPAQKVVFRPEIKVKSRGKFDAVTQSKDDFPGFKSQPKPPKPVDPPQATIQLKFNDK